MRSVADDVVVAIAHDARPAPLVARKFGVSTGTVYRIRAGRTRADVTGLASRQKAQHSAPLDVVPGLEFGCFTSIREIERNRRGIVVLWRCRCGNEVQRAIAQVRARTPEHCAKCSPHERTRRRWQPESPGFVDMGPKALTPPVRR